MLMSPHADDVAKVVAEEGVKVVTTGAGSPEKYMKMWKEAGIKVIPVVASVALAKTNGAVRSRCSGCRGNVSPEDISEKIRRWSWFRRLRTQLQIPVIAAGGIADGRGIAAAFMLGAKAVQMGTRFCCDTKNLSGT